MPEVKVQMNIPESIAFVKETDSAKILYSEREIQLKSNTEKFLTALSIIFLIITFPISIFAAIKVIFYF